MSSGFQSPYSAPGEGDLQDMSSFSKWANDINLNNGPTTSSASLGGTAQLAATSFSVSDLLQGAFNVKDPQDPLQVINNALTADAHFLNTSGQLRSQSRLSGMYTGDIKSANITQPGTNTPSGTGGSIGNGAGDGTASSAETDAISMDQVLALVSEHPTSKAKLWQKRGRASIEMHLGTSDINSSTAPAEGDGHIQLAELPTAQRYPYYMDRVGGPQGGQTVNTRGDRKTVLNEDPNLQGLYGAFGRLSPEEEQYYCSMPWPFANVEQGFAEAGLPEIAAYAQSNILSHANYRYKRVLVYSTKTRKACICTPGDWGPRPQNTRGPNAKAAFKDMIIGLSPDTHHVLGTVHGDEVIVGWVDDSAQLGPFNPGTNNTQTNGTENLTGAATALKWGETQKGAPYIGVRPYSLGNPWPGGTIRSGVDGTDYTFPKGTIGYDCSGFVIACWRKGGIDFWKRFKIGSSYEFNDPRIPDAPPNDLKPGDIVVYGPPPNGHIGHVVLIHHIQDSIPFTLECNAGRGVCISKIINDPTRIIAYKRPSLIPLITPTPRAQ